MKPVFPILLVLLICFSAAAQQPFGDGAPPVANSLEEVRYKRTALLVVFKSRVIDVSDREGAIIQDVLKADPLPSRRYFWVYHIMAQKLNKYIRKHKSLGGATELAQADYVIYFNVVEFRRILYTAYPYGELYVIVIGSPEKLKPPRVIWRTTKLTSAEDAINAFIKDLKTTRGEN